MAGGCCEAVIRSNGGSKVVSIPHIYWGLERGATYRLVITPLSSATDAPPYCCDAKIYPRTQSAIVIVPSCFGVNVGDKVLVWVGDAEDYHNETLPHGRGTTQEERQKDLERAESLFH